MRRAAMMLAGLLLSSGPALAQDEAARLNAAELDGQRGGFETPNGQRIDFGAVVKTYVDGTLALQTRLSWTPQGAVKSLEAGALTEDLAAAAAAHGLALEGAADGVLVAGDGGATVVLHDLSADRIADVVINNANNRDVRQATEITLGIPDFSRLTAEAAGGRADLRLQDAVGAALRDAAIR